MHKIFQTCSLAVSVAGLLLLGGIACSARQTAPAAAPPNKMQERFTVMDVNKDGKVVLEEFRETFPNMNEQAFGMIDLNGDNAIDRAEWFQFTEGHASGNMPGKVERGAPMNNIPGDPLIPPPDANDLPLMRPPNMN